MNNPIIDIIISFLTILISVKLISLYIKKKITVVEGVIYSYALETFVIYEIGPTINSTFFFSYFVFIEVVFIVLKKGIPLSKKSLFILFLPALASVFGFIWYRVNPQIFSASYTDSIIFYTKPIYFYLKNYLPILAIAYKTYLDKKNIDITVFFDTIIKVALFSSIIGFVQILVVKSFNSPDLARLVGVLPRYRGDNNDFWNLPRISAFFNEPKNFSAILGMSIPIALFQRKYWYLIIIIIAGILSISQTFWVVLLSAFISFILLKFIKSVRYIIFVGIGLIISLFILVSTAKDYIIEHSNEFSDSILFVLLAERAISRYGSDELSSDNEFLGMPLQRDMEYPMYKFIIDFPYLILTGYGPGNFSFVSPNYFVGIMGNYIYYQRVERYTSYNVNMRWYYWILETGLISFIIYFYLLTTSTSSFIFRNKYYAFLWLSLFFTNIDIFVIVFFILIKPKPK